MARLATHQATDHAVHRGDRCACELVSSVTVSAEHVYAATLVLARLQDRGVAFSLTLEEMCEILGYLGDGRRPRGVPAERERRDA